MSPLIRNEVVNINLQSKPEWYFALNPLGKVPCIEVEGQLIFESLIIADYLDEVYPEPYLLNNIDPMQKAKDRIMVELFNKVKHIISTPSALDYQTPLSSSRF